MSDIGEKMQASGGPEDSSIEEKETGERNESSKRKLADGKYDPSSPTSKASDDSPAAKRAAIDEKSATKLPNIEPDAKMVAENELSAEVKKKPLESEAVPEDDIPQEGSDKRQSIPFSKSTSDTNIKKKETDEGNSNKKESSKRKLADGEYDRSSLTSEGNDDSPAVKKAATDEVSDTKLPAKPTVFPDLESYWNVVKDDPTDFTRWTYLLQYVGQAVTVKKSNPKKTGKKKPIGDKKAAKVEKSVAKLSVGTEENCHPLKTPKEGKITAEKTATDENSVTTLPVTEKNVSPQITEKKTNKAITDIQPITELAVEYNCNPEINEKMKNKDIVDKKPITELPTDPKGLPELEKYWNDVKENPTDFTGWTYLLQYVHSENNMEVAREAYDSFLAHYPYCYGYWRKYADYERYKGDKEKCEQVFERGLKAIPLSVDLWLHYLNYCKATFADNEEFLRNTFEKALEVCGLEFRSDRLWEAYLKWEGDCKNLLNITQIYDRLLTTPTQGYLSHFDSFSKHVHNNPPNKILSVDEFLTLRQEVLKVLKQSDTPISESISAPGDDVEAPPGEEPAGEAVEAVASHEETATLREKIIAARWKIHSVTKDAVSARQTYEEGIKRPYFHVKPLERCQLKNWKDYLEYEINQGDQKRIVVLFERCLIACALYEDFWLRYLRFLEDKTSDSTDKTRDVYERACTIHHKKKPSLHLSWAFFEEMQGNFDKAADILVNLEKVVPNLIQISYRRINLARRIGKLETASELYEHYIDNVKNRIVANNMTIKYARFCWKILNDIDKAVSLLKKALEKDKENPRLYLQLIDMAMQKNPVDESEVVTVIDQFLARDTAELEQRVMFAQRKIEFFEDFGSSAKSVQRAADEFQTLLKQLQEKKKKVVDDTKMKLDESNSKKTKPDIKDGSGPSHVGPSSQVSQPTSASTGPGYTAPNYNQNYSQPPPQNNYQGEYNNQQPPYNQPPYNQPYNQSDPNYNNYQSWGYSQTSGYGNYNQGWGGYNYY